MKDFSQVRETLDVLVETQEFLKDRLSWATDNFAKCECELSKYHIQGGECFLRNAETGELETCIKYDYDYAKDQYTSAENRLKAVQTVLDYIGGYKL